MIDTRQEIIIALEEAAELEHGLMVQYLFAAMTLKQSEREGLTAAQVDLVIRWRASILDVARQEMGHLGTVQNLLAIIGGAPRFTLPPFPIPAKYYTGKLTFSLEPLTRQTIARFVRFEEPLAQIATLAAVAPDPLDYKSVGDLYNQIIVGIKRIPEAELFIGPRDAQDESRWSLSVEVHPTRTVGETQIAIEKIIEEGEATTTGGPDSHYARFKAIAAQYETELASDPKFVPHRAVVSNPSTRTEHKSTRAYIEDEFSRSLAQLFNASYTTLLLVLSQFYKFQEAVGNPNTDPKDVLKDVALGLMKRVLRPLGPLISDQPLASGTADRAAPCFEIYGSGSVAWDRRVTWIILHEQLRSQQRFTTALVPKLPALSPIEIELDSLASQLHEVID